MGTQPRWYLVSLAAVIAFTGLPAAATPVFTAFGEVASPNSIVHTAPLMSGTVLMATQGQKVEISNATSGQQFNLQISFHLELDGGTVLASDLYNGGATCDSAGFWRRIANSGSGALSSSITFAWGNHSDSAYTDFYDVVDTTLKGNHIATRNFVVTY